MGLSTGDRTSPFNPPIVAAGAVGYPAKITAMSGKVLLPLVFGILDLNKGSVFPEAPVAPAFHADCGPKSHCSQQYERASPSGSVALPVNVKGVFIGIFNPLLGSAFITGV